MSLVVASQPTSLEAVEDQCLMVESWAESCDSIPQLRDASNKLAAISEYLELTSTEGRARVAAAQRRLEVRIGQLLGPASETNGRRPDLSLASERSDLTPNQRSAFRQMAADPETVEDVIATSTDDEPASRRKVTEAIKANKTEPTKPRRTSLPDAAQRAGWEFRRSVERLERIATDDRFPAHREQVAAALSGHHYRPSGRCFYDGSGLNAEPVFAALLTKGHEAVWEMLEDYYRHMVEAAEATLLETS